MENYKIRIPNAERNRQIALDKSYRLGYRWYGFPVPSFMGAANKLYLNNGRITYGESDIVFDSMIGREISYQDFLALPEFDVNNCKIRLSGKDLVSLSSRLIQLGIKGYSTRNTYVQINNPVRDLWGPTLTIIEHPNAYHPEFMFIRNGKTIMVGTEEYFNSLPEKEVTVEQIMQLKTNKTTQIEEKIMGEITLNCIKEPQNAKNITVGRGYTGILINSDDTQVDTWDEASHFLCTNNKGTEAKYKLSLFERVAPPTPVKLTMDQLIAALDVKANRVVVEYNGEEIEVADKGYDNSLSESDSGCSCGIRSIDKLGSLYGWLSTENYSHIEEIVEDFDEDVLIEKLFEKIVVAAIEDVSAAFVLMSTIEDDSEVCEIVDRICETRNGWSTDYARNPNSGNNIKAWLIPVAI